MKKILALVLAVLTLMSVMSACQPAVKVKTGDFTYNSYTTALGTNWNPHTWDTNGDSAIMAYLETPLVDMSILDSNEQIYQWIYEAATSITDVTKDHQDDLTKYDVTLPEGQTAEQTESGYVYEIKLNEKMKWEDGTIINADTYVYSMQQLLDPSMKNYRANLYYDGESAVAGGAKYYYSKDEGLYNSVLSLGYADAEAAQADGKTVYLDMWNFYGLEGAVDADGNECPQWVDITDTHIYIDPADNSEVSAADIYGAYGPAGYFGEGGNPECLAIYVQNEDFGATWDAVGLYKVDDYTIRYVCQTAIELNYFLTSCTSNWLVYESYYEAGKDTTGELVTTDYNTKKENTMSYGPYKIESLEVDKQIVFVQNENWYDWEEKDGQLVSFTDFKVDGQSVQQYQTTKVVIDVIQEPAAAKQAFLKGELTDWSPEADELVTYGTSDQMYKADETYTMSFFFNTDVEALQTMDASKGNTNSVVLSNYNFRKAMSLAIDRADLIKSTAGYTPAYATMNNLYYYDVYNDPTSSYRKSEPAMEAICKLYGVEYGEGKAYATLEEAYKSINGQNMTEAKALMATACQELVDAGLYTAGEDIVINIGWAKGSISSSDEAQVTKLEGYFNEALADSGFGKIDLVAVGNIDNRYDAVPAGEYAIGWGAWGGAAFYPFRNFQVYCDPDQYSVNEMGCWDPTTETLTLTVNGEEVTMTWQEWSGALMGTGKYANADFATKLQITADMEYEYLNKYYRIPMAGTTSCSMLSYKVKYYTEDYNIMYGWGGLRLMTYNYNDAEWTEYVSSQGGTLSYE